MHFHSPYKCHCTGGITPKDFIMNTDPSLLTVIIATRDGDLATTQHKGKVGPDWKARKFVV